MVNVIKQEVRMEESLRKKLEFICSFCNTKCEIQKGSIRTIERTNLSYVEPHRIIINSWYDKDDKYIDVVNDMYEDNVLDDDDIEELDLNKEKDDFER